MKAVQRSCYEEITAPGEFIYTTRSGVEGHTGMIISCPGCGSMSALQLEHESMEPDRPTWNKSGEDDRPTLKPSVHHKDGCGWHGWLTDGQWVK